MKRCHRGSEALYRRFNQSLVRKDGFLRWNRVSVEKAQERRHMNDAVPIANESLKRSHSLRIQAYRSEVDPVRGPKCASHLIVVLEIYLPGINDDPQ